MAQLLKAGHNQSDKCGRCFCALLILETPSGGFYSLENMLLLRINSPKEYPSSPSSNGIPCLQRLHCEGDTALKVISSFRCWY